MEKLADSKYRVDITLQSYSEKKLLLEYVNKGFDLFDDSDSLGNLEMFNELSDTVINCNVVTYERFYAKYKNKISLHSYSIIDKGKLDYNLRSGYARPVLAVNFAIAEELGIQLKGFGSFSSPNTIQLAAYKKFEQKTEKHEEEVKGNWQQEFKAKVDTWFDEQVNSWWFTGTSEYIQDAMKNVDEFASKFRASTGSNLFDSFSGTTSALGSAIGGGLDSIEKTATSSNQQLANDMLQNRNMDISVQLKGSPLSPNFDKTKEGTVTAKSAGEGYKGLNIHPADFNPETKSGKGVYIDFLTSSDLRTTGFTIDKSDADLPAKLVFDPPSLAIFGELEVSESGTITKDKVDEAYSFTNETLKSAIQENIYNLTNKPTSDGLAIGIKAHAIPEKNALETSRMVPAYFVNTDQELSENADATTVDLVYTPAWAPTREELNTFYLQSTLDLLPVYFDEDLDPEGLGNIPAKDVKRALQFGDSDRRLAVSNAEQKLENVELAEVELVAEKEKVSASSLYSDEFGQIAAIIRAHDAQMQRFIAFFTVRDGDTRYLLPMQTASGDGKYHYYFYTNGFDLSPVKKASTSFSYGAFKTTVSLDKPDGNTNISFSVPADLELSFWRFVEEKGLGINVEQGYYSTEATAPEGEAVDINFILSETLDPEKPEDIRVNLFVAENVKFSQISNIAFQMAAGGPLKHAVKGVFRRLKWYHHLPLTVDESDAASTNHPLLYSIPNVTIPNSKAMKASETIREPSNSSQAENN